MNKKTISILLAVFIMLVLVALLMNSMGKRGEKKEDKESILFPGLTADQVSAVEIKSKDKEVKLNREGDSWVVATADNYAADPEAMEKILDTIVELKAAAIASKSADKHSQFEVDAENAVEVKAMGSGDGNLLAHFFVGKMGSDFTSTYVRKADQDAVVKADGYLRGIFDRGTRGWRDRAIFKFDVGQVQRLTLVSQGQEEIAIEAQEDGNWQLTKPEVSPGKKDEIDRIMRDLSKLSADDFADKEEATDEEAVLYKLDKPQFEATIELKDGTMRVLHVGNMSGQQYYVKREANDMVFMLSKSKIDGIFKDAAELKTEITETPEPEESNPTDLP